MLPLRSKDALQKALPSLPGKFPTYRSFASSRLEDILDLKSLETAYKLEVNTLQSGVLLNDGQGRFTFHALSCLAQAAPASGAVLTELDGDSQADLCLAQNFFSPQGETGRMDGGVSLLLKGQGDGTFEAVWPDRSGLVVPGDARSLTPADLNGDGWPDLIVGVNQGEIMAFVNQGRKDARMLAVQLHGKPGNPTAVGARVTVHVNGLSPQAAEWHAGGGYLSQSGSTLFFGLGAARQVNRVDVRWPDGQLASHHPKTPGPVLHLKQE